MAKQKKRKYTTAAGEQVAYIFKQAKPKQWFSTRSVADALNLGVSTVRAALLRMCERGQLQVRIDLSDGVRVYSRTGRL